MAYIVTKTSAKKEEPKKETPKPPEINQAAIGGEPGTGYEGPTGGEFECENCEYFDPDTVSCGQDDMVKNSKRPKIDRDGSMRVVVHPEGCCEYVKRIGKEDKE
jgi:hypothetical protein